MPLTRRQAVAFAFAPVALASAPSARAAGADDPRWAHDPRLAQLWRCTFPDCTPYIYDPLEGAPESDPPIPPGTAFEDVPEDWWCPDCASGKEVFIRQVNRAEL
jgi:rubredoxin